MSRSSRSSASASCATAVKALPRWLTSMTEVPLPCQSSSSSRTCSSTSTGSVAGPAAKLNTRTSSIALRFGRRWQLVGRVAGRVAGRGVGRVVRDPFLAVPIEALDAFDADQSLAFAETDEPHPLGVTTLHRDAIDRGAHQRAGRADEHDLLSRHDLQRRYREAVAIGGLERDHALTAAAVDRKLRERRELAVAGRRGREHVALAHDDECDQVLTGAELDAAHARGLASHVTHLALV